MERSLQLRQRPQARGGEDTQQRWLCCPRPVTHTNTLAVKCECCFSTRHITFSLLSLGVPSTDGLLYL